MLEALQAEAPDVPQYRYMLALCLRESSPPGVFYEETTVFANRTILIQLFTFFGIEGIIELLEEKLLKIDYSEFFLGVHSTGSSNLQYHNVVQASLPSQNLQLDLIKLCQDLTGKTGKGCL